MHSNFISFHYAVQAMASSLPVRCARFCSSVAKPAGALIPHVATRNSLRISRNVFAHSNVTSSSSAFCSRALQEVHTRATVEQANDSISVAESGSTEPFNTWKIKMLYDGECPLCMREVNMLRERNKLYGTIKFVDISSNDYSPDENAGLNYKTVMGSIHAILYDGTVLTNIAAFKRLYEEVGLGWVYAITKYKPIAIIADAIYAVWAKYRLQITGRPPLDKVIEEREQKKDETCNREGRCRT